LGIASAFLCNHTIGKLNIGFAQHLDRSRLELSIVRPESQRDMLSAFFDQFAANVITVPRNLPAARGLIAAAELDALFYTDVGMDPFMYFLAFARLARIQFTTWGHPVTTGIPNMDFFISSKRVEPADGARRYHEKLVEFSSLPSFYQRPRAPSDIDVRARLGLAPSDRLYACPQTIFKFHPDLDDALVAVLRSDPHGHVVVIASAHAAWNEVLRARLQRAGADVEARIRFIPAVPLPDYLALLRDADALLDTFHFGGGNSSYESLSMGAPVVTLPGAAMRSRITAGWYRAMDNPQWIARSPAHFVELALELATETGRRAEWRARVCEGAGTLLENAAVVRELENFVADALAAN
jgi:predicted O-linked N-acetylglucosamine transferase (SPINDLY family)